MNINFRQIFENFHPLFKLIFDILMSLMVFFILFVLGSKILSLFYGIDSALFFGATNGEPELSVLRTAQILYSISLFLLPPVAISLFYTKKTSSFFGLNKSASTINYLNVFFLIFAALPIVNFLAAFNGGLHLPESMASIEEIWRKAEDSSKALGMKLLSVDTTQLLFVNLFMMAVLPAVGEEIFFRGLFQKHLIEWTKNIHLGIFIAAFLFSAFHFQFFTFIPRLFLGIVLGYLFVWSKSLWLPIFAHFVNNAMAVIASYLIFKKNGSLTQEIDTFGADPQTFMFTLFSLLIFSFLLFFIYRNEKRKQII